MFPVCDWFTSDEYDFCELLVHGDMVLYRRHRSAGNTWEVQLSSGTWEKETILHNTITEIYESVSDLGRM